MDNKPDYVYTWPKFPNGKDWYSYEDISVLGLDPSAGIISDLTIKVSFLCTCSSQHKKIKCKWDSKPQEYSLWSGSVIRSRYFINLLLNLMESNKSNQSGRYPVLNIKEFCTHFNSFYVFLQLLSRLHSTDDSIKLLNSIKNESTVVSNQSSFFNTIYSENFKIGTLASKYNFPLVEHFCFLLGAHTALANHANLDFIVAQLNITDYANLNNNYTQENSVQDYKALKYCSDFQNQSFSIYNSLKIDRSYQFSNDKWYSQVLYTSCGPFAITASHDKQSCIFCNAIPDVDLKAIDLTSFRNYVFEYYSQLSRKIHNCMLDREKLPENDKVLKTIKNVCTIDKDGKNSVIEFYSAFNVNETKPEAAPEYYYIGSLFIPTYQKYVELYLGIQVLCLEDTVRILFKIHFSGMVFQSEQFKFEGKQFCMTLKLQVFGYSCGYISMKDFSLHSITLLVESLEKTEEDLLKRSPLPVGKIDIVLQNNDHVNILTTKSKNITKRKCILSETLESLGNNEITMGITNELKSCSSSEEDTYNEMDYNDFEFGNMDYSCCFKEAMLSDTVKRNMIIVCATSTLGH